MEDRDDWRLGDEGDAAACPRCGKRNRARLSYCAICGSPLKDELEADPGSLRTLGEAMGGTRRARAPQRRSLRGWTITAVLLLATVVVLTWLHTREQPFRIEDLMPAPTPVAPIVTATPVATRVVVATRHPVAPSPAPVVAPPAPTEVPATVAATPVPVATARATVVRPVATRTARRPRPTPTRRPAVETEVAPPIDDRPRVAATEKPSLGTDLQEATRAYRRAVEVHNERVDEYNALADEVQRRNAWDDSEASVELRRRVDRAREAVESARVQAEMLRAQMESVRSRYR